MGNVRFTNEEGVVTTLDVSTDVEAQVLAIQYLTKAVYRMGNRRDG